MPEERGRKHILVVDDEAPVRALLRECLELEGYRVSEAKDGGELASRMSEASVDLITLDLSLGGEDGLDLARRIRATTNVPIVMISGRGDTIDRVVGLELGADDYIAKPFHLREVLARVRAVLRRYEAQGPAAGHLPGASAAPRYAFSGWVLDTATRELKADGAEATTLTTAEYDLLRLFVERPGRVLSRDEIMDRLKGHDWAPFDRSIDSLVVRLRRKIEREPAAPRLVKSVRGVGYVFTAEVKRL